MVALTTVFLIVRIVLANVVRAFAEEDDSATDYDETEDTPKWVNGLAIINMISEYKDTLCFFLYVNSRMILTMLLLLLLVWICFALFILSTLR